MSQIFKKLTILPLILFFISGGLLAQHIEEVGHVNFGIPGNDCWGYIDSSGTEYAIMGLEAKAVIYSLEDPSNPRFIAEFPGTGSIWRDIKSWKNYIYVVTEAADGILIINMNDTSNITSKFFTPQIPINGSTTPLQTAHNIYIDENGFAYLAGTKVGVGGVVIFDLKPDPENPVYVGIENEAYAHDVVTQRDTMFTSDIYVGELRIWDVHDKSNPVLIGRHSTTSNFTHNAWPSPDGKYVFTTDERPEGRLDAYDISNLEDIRRIDTYKSKDGMNRGVIPHNTHYHNGFLVTSWYSDGVIIIDANRPDNLVEVGRFETYHGSGAGFNGCWGAFPYYPSGLIIASDRSEGLYILRPDYQRACYLEGTTLDYDTKDPIQSVRVHIESQQHNFEQTDIEGIFKTGLADSGTYKVTFSHPDYFPLTVEHVKLKNGEVTRLNVNLQKKAQIPVTGQVVDAKTKAPVPNAWVILSSSERSTVSRTDKDGLFTLKIIARSINELSLIAGKWGYRHQPASLGSGQNDLVIPLRKGYQDDFVADQNWRISADAATGNWEWGVPVPSPTGGPMEDVPDDLGQSCYVTGNKGTSTGEDDIDAGTTTLLSPSMNLSEYNHPYLHLKYWFTNFGGGGTPPNDSLIINILKGDTKIHTFFTTTSANEWKPLTIDLLPYKDKGLSDIKLQIISGDFNPGHVVEAGIDQFVVVDSFPSATLNYYPDNTVYCYPNPAHEQLYIRLPAKYNDSQWEVSIISVLGTPAGHLSKIHSKDLEKGIDLQDLHPGSYLLELQSKSGEVLTTKFIKQ